MPKSFATPICHLPAGSGNGLSATFGLWTPETAVHALVKGSVKSIDAASVFLASESVPRLSILSVQYGLLADLDLGTEHLRRLLGGERFTYGAVREIVKWRKHKANIAFFQEPASEAITSEKDVKYVLHSSPDVLLSAEVVYLNVACIFQRCDSREYPVAVAFHRRTDEHEVFVVTCYHDIL